MKQKLKTYFSLRYKKEAGFTLIELLVVIAVIGLLATIVSVSVNNARTKARDVKRIADLKNIQLALELYYDQYNQYPNVGVYAYVSDSGCGTNWCVLESALSAYMPTLPRDPKSGYNYYYDADSGDSNQTYGLMAQMEHSGNFPLAANDGGAYNSNGAYYEIGSQVGYCSQRYVSGNWWTNNNTVCTGGN